jgi:hypothetical protein
MTRRTLILTGLLTLTLAAPAQADFGRMFPRAPGFTDPSAQQLADLAQTMLDPNADTGDNLQVPSGFTYGGQFLDHDLTLDVTPQPFAPVDPVGLPNGRTFRLDLDSVYGAGPNWSPQLYEADGAHLRVGASFGQPDLPRNPDGSAIIAEGRNDENEIISQIHVAFLRAHNRLIDEGHPFTEAQTILRHAWQRIVLDEYLPAVLGQATVDAARSDHGNRLYKPGNPNNPMTPVEFSVAAFRFGHSEVRRAYELNEATGKIQAFSFTAPDLRGGRSLPVGRQIDWGNFFDELADPNDADGGNHTRHIDTLISLSLFQLPIPGAEASGSNVLAFRNMLRAKFYGLPSYETVARELGVTPVGPPVFPGGTPLWYGILRESEAGGGLITGPVGGTIIAETIVGLLEADRTSVLRAPKEPVAPVALVGPDGQPSFSDLLVFAGLANFPR